MYDVNLVRTVSDVPLRDWKLRIAENLGIYAYKSKGKYKG